MTVSLEPGSQAIDIWPPRIHLSSSQRRHVLDRLREHDERCPACGLPISETGDPLTAMAVHDRADAYCVVVKCGAPTCAGGQWSVRMHARQFLHVGRR